MRLRKDNFAIYIVTYNRPSALNAAIRQYLDSIPFTPAITVISNHTDCTIEPELRPYVEVIFNTLRPNESFGYASRSVNHCFQLGFRRYEWLLCSQDDVIVKPGWFKLVNETPYEFYLAPVGDTRFLLSRTAFRRVGWFDERFTGIGYQEHDYILRVINLMPREASIVDQQFSGTVLNPIGLEHFWIQPDEGVFGFKKFEQRTVAQHPHLVRTFVEKWGFYPDRRFIGIHPSRLPREVDWYPYLSARYQVLAFDNPQYDMPLIHLQEHRSGASGVLEVPSCPVLALCHIPQDPGAPTATMCEQLVRTLGRHQTLGFIVLGPTQRLKEMEGSLTALFQQQGLSHAISQVGFLDESQGGVTVLELLGLVDFCVSFGTGSSPAYEEARAQLRKDELRLEQLEHLDRAGLEALCSKDAGKSVVLVGIDPKDLQAVARTFLRLLWDRFVPRRIRAIAKALRNGVRAALIPARRSPMPGRVR